MSRSSLRPAAASRTVDRRRTVAALEVDRADAGIDADVATDPRATRDDARLPITVIPVLSRAGSCSFGVSGSARRRSPTRAR